MRQRWLQKGFTLIEMVGIVMILGILLAAFTFTLGSATPNTPARVAAEALAEVLKSAQRRAVAEGVTTAVVFPTNGGTASVFQSYYLLQGMKHPEFVMGHDLSSEQERVYWTTAHDATFPGLTLTLPVENRLGVDLELWDPPFPTDHHLIFLPNGEACSNGLPVYGQEFRIVVADEMTVSPDSPSGSPPVGWSARLSKLERCSPCASVSIGLDGTISVHDQLPGGTIPLAEELPVPTVGELPSAPTEPVPELLLTGPIELSPDPEEVREMLIPGTDALIDERRHLRLRSRASSNRGFPMFSQWTATLIAPSPYTGSSVGAFSSPTDGKMTWDAQAEEWVSEWAWAPPPGSNGAAFELTGAFRDSEGNLVTSSSVVRVIKVGVSRDPNIIGFVSERRTIANPTGRRRPYLIRGNGTDVQSLASIPEEVTETHLSPDGQWLAFVYIPSGYPADRTRVAISRLDGSGRINVRGSGPAGADWYPVWAPGGQYIVFHRRLNAGGWDTQLLVARMADRAGSDASGFSITPRLLLDDPSTTRWYTEANISPTPLPNGRHRFAAIWFLDPHSEIVIWEINSNGSLETGTRVQVTDWGAGQTMPVFHPANPNLISFGTNPPTPPGIDNGCMVANLAAVVANPALASGATHVTRLSAVPSPAKFAAGTGEVFYLDDSGGSRSAFRRSFAPLGTPELRLTRGGDGFLVTREGHMYANVPGRGGENDLVILRDVDPADGFLRVTSNAVYDRLMTTVRLP